VAGNCEMGRWGSRRRAGGVESDECSTLHRTVVTTNFISDYLAFWTHSATQHSATANFWRSAIVPVICHIARDLFVGRFTSTAAYGTCA